MWYPLAAGTGYPYSGAVLSATTALLSVAIALAGANLYLIVLLLTGKLAPLHSAQIAQLRRDVVEIADDVEQLHQLHHRKARRENIETAREGKGRAADLKAEAAAVLSAAANPPPTSPPPATEKDALRRRFFQ